MPTEEEETEILEVVDIGHLRREEKRAKENRAAAKAEERQGVSTFFERSWRRAAPESLSAIHSAVDALGTAPARPPAPTSDPVPEGLLAEEAAALTRFLGRRPGAVVVAQRGDRGLLVETEGRLLSVRGGEVRELRDVVEPPPTASVPDPTPAPQPAELPPKATTQVGQPEAPPPEPGKTGKRRGGLASRLSPKKPEEPAPAEEKPSRLSGLKGKLPFGKKKD